MIFERLSPSLWTSLMLMKIRLLKRQISKMIRCGFSDIVDLVMSFEEEFDIEIPDEDVENIKPSVMSLSILKIN